jgi:hypothetical protein
MPTKPEGGASCLACFPPECLHKANTQAWSLNADNGNLRLDPRHSRSRDNRNPKRDLQPARDKFALHDHLAIRAVAKDLRVQSPKALLRRRLGSRHSGADLAHFGNAGDTQTLAFKARIRGSILAGVCKAVPTGGEVCAVGVAMRAHSAIA